MDIRKAYSLSEFGVQLHKFTLQNGLPVAFIEKPYSPIHAQMIMAAGSLFNPSDNGLAHFTEHMIMGTSARLPRKELIAQIVNSIGGYSNASTGGRAMTLECEIALSEHLPSMAEHFSEVLGDMYITPVLLEKEKGVITSETLKSLSNPSYVSGRYMRSCITPNTPWSYSNLGELDAMQLLTAEDVRSFYETYCCLENMMLVISGGCSIDDIKKTFETVRLHSGGTRAILPPDPTVLSPGHRIFYEQSISQVEILVGFNGPEINTRESAILKFALEYAHSGLDSLFLTKIRNERGLAYSARFVTLCFNTIQYLGTSLAVPPEKIDESIETVLECYVEFLHNGMNIEQIKARIDRTYFKERRSFECVKSWVDAFDELLFDEGQNLMIGDYPDIFNFWETITPEEVSIVLKKYITVDNFHLFIIGKESSKKYA